MVEVRIFQPTLPHSRRKSDVDLTLEQEVLSAQIWTVVLAEIVFETVVRIAVAVRSSRDRAEAISNRTQYIVISSLYRNVSMLTTPSI